MSSRIVSSAVLSMRTCVCAVTTFEPSSLSKRRGPISAPSKPIIASTTRSSTRVNPCWDRPSSDSARLGSQRNIVDARNCGEQGDYDPPDQETDGAYCDRFMQRHQQFDPVASLLLGQSRSGPQHVGKATRPFPDPDQ